MVVKTKKTASRKMTAVLGGAFRQGLPMAGGCEGSLADFEDPALTGIAYHRSLLKNGS
jgi:hypothetical protein